MNKNIIIDVHNSTITWNIVQSFRLNSDNETTPRAIYNIANAFYLAGKRCLTDVKLLQSTEYLLIPWITNLCFSCELFMKSIYFNNSWKKVHWHELKELFEKLPINIQKNINDFFSSQISEITPKDFINEISDYFVKIRYDFENVIEAYRDYEIWIFSDSLYNETSKIFWINVWQNIYVINKIK